VYDPFDPARDLPLLDAIDGAIDLIYPPGLAPNHGGFLDAFDRIRLLETDQTGITPSMGYFLYDVARSAPADAVCLGAYTGISAAFLAAGALASPRNLRARGVESDRAAAAVAARNMERLAPSAERASVAHADPAQWLAERSDAIGALFLDVLDPVRQKADYAVLAHAALGLMPRDSVLIAHDALIERWGDDIRALEIALTSSGRVQRMMRLPVDPVGALVVVLA
jgi:predicted O-methyltransferase YrrM